MGEKVANSNGERCEDLHRTGEICSRHIVRLHEPLVWWRTAILAILDRDYLKDIQWPASGQWDLGEADIAILQILNNVRCYYLWKT